MDVLLVYAKNKSFANDLGYFEEDDISNYSEKDEIGNYKQGSQLEKWGNDDTTHTHPNLAYSIYYNPLNSDVQHRFDYNQEEINKDRSLTIKYSEPDKDLLSQGYVCIRPRKTNAGEHGRWRLEPSTFYERLHKQGFIFKKQKDGYKIYEKSRYSGGKFKKAKDFLPSDIAKQNSDELLAIFGSKVFAYPKPLSLMNYILMIINNKSATILDFFAGSGTTGHAVLKLNAEDGGHRRFILCTNNENGICRDITYERLRTVITGKRRDGSAYSDGLPGSLKYFRVDFVPVGEKEYYEYADKLLLHVRELVELENAVNFKGNSRIAIVLTDEELKAFFAQTLKQVQGDPFEQGAEGSFETARNRCEDYSAVLLSRVERLGAVYELDEIPAERDA